MAPAARVHRFFSDLAAHNGSYVHLLHPGGLLPEALLRAVPASSARTVPHVGGGSNSGLVGSLASGVHEVSGAGSTRGRSRAVVVEEAEDGDEGKRRDPGTLSWYLAGNSTKFCCQWLQHDCDAVRSEKSFSAWIKRLIP